MSKKDVVAPAAPVAKVGYVVTLNGVPRAFGVRAPLKKERAGIPATICGKPGTVVVISAREFGDNRVWVKLPNGDTGRFLVPKDVDLNGELVIDVKAGSVEYDREALRVRPIVRRSKVATDATPAEAVAA